MRHPVQIGRDGRASIAAVISGKPVIIDESTEALAINEYRRLEVEAAGCEFSEFVRGQLDCQKGEPHKPDQSESYNKGYAAQYQHEQNMTAASEVQHG